MLGNVVWSCPLERDGLFASAVLTAPCPSFQPTGSIAQLLLLPGAQICIMLAHTEQGFYSGGTLEPQSLPCILHGVGIYLLMIE